MHVPWGNGGMHNCLGARPSAKASGKLWSWDLTRQIINRLFASAASTLSLSRSMVTPMPAHASNGLTLSRRRGCSVLPTVHCPQVLCTPAAYMCWHLCCHLRNDLVMIGRDQQNLGQATNCSTADSMNKVHDGCRQEQPDCGFHRVSRANSAVRAYRHRISNSPLDNASV